MAIAMAWVDVPLARWIHAHETVPMKVLGQWLEEIGKSHWVLGYCLIMIAISWRSMRARAWDHMQLFAAVAASGIIANIIKVIACRPRPPLLLMSGITAWDWFAFHTDFLWNSFPSGHSTTGLAIAVVASSAWPRYRAAFWTIGLAIALGRLMLDVHYLSDVIAGGMLGAAISYKVQATSDKLQATRLSS
jgi:undecaprenyl-diphosphatase